MTGAAQAEADRRWMAAALALGARGHGQTMPNPAVGCIVVDQQGRVAGRGWTQPGGRPHAEAVALAQAGQKARGATVYVTLEPCAHQSPRGPACTDLLIAAAPARVVIALSDPDSRTNGSGIARLKKADIVVAAGVHAREAALLSGGFLNRVMLGRPRVTLKLATSLDGRIALASGESRWITGPLARAHAHAERARTDAILVGRGTLLADAPRLDVRLPGLEDRSPRRLLLSRQAGEPERAAGWQLLSTPGEIATLTDVNDVLVEGGAGAAAAFLRADLVDRLVLYRAPILIGDGQPALNNIGLDALNEAHGRWSLAESRSLGPDRLDIFLRARAAPG